MIFKVSHNSNCSLDNNSECTLKCVPFLILKDSRLLLKVWHALLLSLVNYSEYSLRWAQFMNKTKERREYYKFYTAITSPSLFECRCWSACLDTASWHAHQGAAKWWFHIYQLVQAYLYPQEDQEQVRPSRPCTTSRKNQQNHKAKRKYFKWKVMKIVILGYFLLQFRTFVRFLLFSH